MNSSIKRFGRKALTLFAVLYLFIGAPPPARSEKLYLDQDEQDYIAGVSVIKAASIDGGAPLHYRNSKGEIRGIAVAVLDEIASMTGLNFEYSLYDSIGDALHSGADILFGVTIEYAPPGVVLSVPYLESETVLYYNSSLDPKQLDKKRFAAIRGGTLPQGVAGENTIYFNNREDAITAVEAGRADYGYGNAYSLAFYTLQNGYENIITIPTGKEERAYCIGLVKEDDVLLDIINKSIGAIDRNRMQTLILDIASQVEKKITLTMFIDAYGVWIISAILLVAVILVFSVFSSMHARNLCKMENRRYRLLSHISNECLFEYGMKSRALKISDKFYEIFGMEENEAVITNLLIEALNTLKDHEPNEMLSTIKLPVSNGGVGVFRIVCSNISDDKGRPYSMIGKLIDITEEFMERERLITISQLDGLTGLYNAVTAEKLIAGSIKNRDGNRSDALIIIDCDNFKNINDTLGHLEGNRVLKSISKGLRLTFRQTDIIGRIGGDEFCVYMQNIPSAEFVRSRCLQLSDLVGELNGDFMIMFSMGIAILDEENTYEGLFKKADDALYLAKRRGGAHFVVYGEDQERIEDQRDDADISITTNFDKA